MVSLHAKTTVQNAIQKKCRKNIMFTSELSKDNFVNSSCSTVLFSWNADLNFSHSHYNLNSPVSMIACARRMTWIWWCWLKPLLISRPSLNPNSWSPLPPLLEANFDFTFLATLWKRLYSCIIMLDDVMYAVFGLVSSSKMMDPSGQVLPLDVHAEARFCWTDCKLPESSNNL